MVPNYREMIKNPMDLGTIRHKALCGEYGLIHESFAKDVNLIWKNAMMFNPQASPIHQLAVDLAKRFQELYCPIAGSATSLRVPKAGPASRSPRAELILPFFKLLQPDPYRDIASFKQPQTYIKYSQGRQHGEPGWKCQRGRHPGCPALLNLPSPRANPAGKSVGTASDANSKNVSVDDGCSDSDDEVAGGFKHKLIAPPEVPISIPSPSNRRKRQKKPPAPRKRKLKARPQTHTRDAVHLVPVPGPELALASGAKSRRVKVGDHVACCPTLDDEEEYIGAVLSIECDANDRLGNVLLKIQWFYRPEDLPNGRQMYHGFQELIESAHSDYVSVDTARCIVEVRSVTAKNCTPVKTLESLKSLPKGAYFYRFRFNEATQKIVKMTNFLRLGM